MRSDSQTQISLKVKLMVTSKKKKKEENCDVLTDNVFIYVECSQVSIITIQSHRLFFVKTPGGVKRHSCLCCRAGFFFFFFNKVHLCAIEWNIPCYSSYTHKYHKTMFLVITASP